MEAALVMATVALALCVSSLIEVAVIVTLPAVEGAVKVVLVPLAVLAELKLDAPQDVAGVQLQFTPKPAGSPVTVAAMVAGALAARDAGGAMPEENATEITVALIAMERLVALIVLVVTEVAVTVTAATAVVGAV